MLLRSANLPPNQQDESDRQITMNHEAIVAVDLRKSKTLWPLSMKIKRGLWNLVSITLFRLTPPRLGNSWRIWLLRMFGAQIEGEVLVFGSCKILQPWKLRLGDGSAIGHHTELYNFAQITIGRMTVVSQYSYLCTGTHDYSDPYMPLIWKPIDIGNECWVAAGAFIAPGVKIGDGAVIGARSVVTRDMPEWMVCAGNPCRPLKPRVVVSATADSCSGDR